MWLHVSWKSTERKQDFIWDTSSQIHKCLYITKRPSHRLHQGSSAECTDVNGKARRWQKNCIACGRVEWISDSSAAVIACCLRDSNKEESLILYVKVQSASLAKIWDIGPPGQCDSSDHNEPCLANTARWTELQMTTAVSHNFTTPRCHLRP